MVCIANNIWSITWASLPPSPARAARCIVRGRDGEDRCIVSTVAARTTSEIVDQHPTERPNDGQPTPFARSLVRSRAKIYMASTRRRRTRTVLHVALVSHFE